MIYDFKYLRPYPPKYPAYPPYSKVEDYMEHYFYRFYKNNAKQFEKCEHQYIPVFWTTLYNDNIPVNTQEYLDALDPRKKYFTINQHDDGIRYNIPQDTLIFSASENGKGTIIPIPLITSPIDIYGNVEKDILCSFVGTITHPIRKKLYDMYHNKNKFYFSKELNWSPLVPDDKLEEFRRITSRSKYTLCPRGNIIQSFRIYETIQLGSVPIIITDKYTYPFGNSIDWNSFSLIISENKIGDIENIINDIPDDTYNDMLRIGKEIYNKNFTLDSMCINIQRILCN